MTEEELNTIESRAKAATKGPWILAPNEFYEDFDPNIVITADDSGPCISESYSERADSEFIAHARTDVPALIAEVRRLQELQRKMENSWAELFTKYLALGGLKDEE